MVYEDFVLVKTRIILFAFRKLTFGLLLYNIYDFIRLPSDRIRGMAVVKFLFDTGNFRLVVRRKQSHMHLLKIPVFTEDMTFIRHDCLQTKAFYSFYFLIGIGNTP